MKMFKLPIRIWILIVALFLALLAINPSPSAEGIQIKTIDTGEWTDAGLNTGQIVTSINNEQITSIPQFYTVLLSLESPEKNITIITDEREYNYEIKDDIGFSVDTNLTVIDSTLAPLQKGEVITIIDGEEVSNSTDFEKVLDTILPKSVLKINTDKGQFAFLSRKVPKITVGEAAKSNIRKGLDLEGGTRVLLRPVSDAGVTDNDISELIQVLNNRLNVYGLTDLRIRAASDWAGSKYILIEIAGVTKEEVSDLIGQQGKFEARIANETVFSGGKKDIPFVCRNDGSCAGIKNCFETGGQSVCRFEFVIHLSPDAAERHANITSVLEVITAEESGKEILSENLDLYLDEKLVDTLQIGADLKGSETTNIAISGSGVGANRNAAVDAAVANMNKLQTILITGSLPFDLEIDKLDSISPVLGKSFVKNSFIVGLVALLAVAVIILIRYRNIKIILPMMLTSASELFIILGFASITHWNLDTASIAGIIAAIGTGVDHQIVIIDEVSKGSDKYMSWKQQIKRAFFIIFVAYATTVAAMVPLWNAGAGLLRGFALTTIVGVSIGVFITRPAFAAIVEKLVKK